MVLKICEKFFFETGKIEGRCFDEIGYETVMF